MKIRKIPRNSLVGTVADRIREVINTRKLNAGDRLPSETDLVEGLGVSRSVVREAIGRLEVVGLVTVQRGRGMFVGNSDSLARCVKLVRTGMDISTRDMRQLVEFRTALECQAARQAAERATPENVAELSALCDELQVTTDQAAGIAVDFRFHRKMAEISGNVILTQVMEVVHDYVVEAMIRAASEPRNSVLIANLHRPIVAAIAAGDPEAAEREMRAHMERHVRRLDGWAE